LVWFAGTGLAASWKHKRSASVTAGQAGLRDKHNERISGSAAFRYDDEFDVLQRSHVHSAVASGDCGLGEAGSSESCHEEGGSEHRECLFVGSRWRD